MILLIDAAATLLLLITAINENYHESLKSKVILGILLRYPSLSFPIEHFSDYAHCNV